MNLLSLPENPLPLGTRLHPLVTSGGVRLRAVSWLPEGPSRGTILILQGRAEMVEKYFELADELRARGFAVASFDWRGQGGSDRLAAHPLKGHVDALADYEADLATVIEAVLLPFCPPPYHVLAHSTGGLVILHRLARGRAPFQSAVLTAPLLDLGRLYPPSRLIGPLACALTDARLGSAWPPGAVFLGSSVGGFKGNALTGDARRFARMEAIRAARPDLALGAPTIGWLAAVSRAMKEAATPPFAAALDLPILLTCGSADIVVASAVTLRFAARLARGRAVLIESARHEILMEREEIRAIFWAAFDAFMTEVEAQESACANA